VTEVSRYAPGSFCWVGLATSDRAAATAFYTSLFGWEAEALAAGAYTLLRRDGGEVAILYRQTPQARAAGAPPHWTSFISVEDAAATAARAGELGGAAVFREPFDVLGEGRVAAIRDPVGATVSLWQPRARAGATLRDAVGALCWNELATPAVERCKAFYGRLLGWEYETGECGYVTIGNAGRPNGGMRERRDIPSRWLPFFMVESAAEGAGAAKRLGGGRLRGDAVLEDPQGAAFAVLEPGAVRRAP
jgi:uncharacterized protein